MNQHANGVERPLKKRKKTELDDVAERYFQPSPNGKDVAVGKTLVSREPAAEVLALPSLVANETTHEERKQNRKEKKKERRKGHGRKELPESVPIQLPDVNGGPDSGYREHPELSGLSQTDIDEYLNANFISISSPNSENSNFRPVIEFSYLTPTPEEAKVFKTYTSPTPIQASAWPFLLAGQDMVGVAETGSGKTLAYGVPLVRYVSKKRSKSKARIRAIVVSPTRELALQIHEQIEELVSGTSLSSVCIYGGVPKDEQRPALQQSQIVIATPGRLNDFIQEGAADLSHVSFVVLDEADRMLEKGFEDEVRKILESTAKDSQRQTSMFTATWPQSIRDLAASFMTRPIRINIGENASGELRANSRVAQQVEVIDPYSKDKRLVEILKRHYSEHGKNDRILIFCLYKKEAARMERFLQAKGFRAGGIHGDMNQGARIASLEAFRSGQVPLLVATDVAARGLDIPSVKLVVNVTFPLTVEDYVHRIGRTGRAGNDGLAITLFTIHDKALSGALINVLRAAKQHVPEELLKFGGTVKRKTHDLYGAFHKDTSDMSPQTKKITFD